MPGPLDGVRILDVTSVGFGTYACQILGDYGAEVIKVEAPEGDITRGIAPFRTPGMGHFFLMANRNKRSIVLDLKTEGGRQAFLKLVSRADAMLCSVRPAAMDRLGLGADACRAINPKLVHVSLVGFGQSGPYARRPAYDDIIQGMSGMAAMQGGRNGPPAFVNASVCDKICSQIAAHATLAALFNSQRTGTGQSVEVPMLESMVGFNLIEHHAGQAFDPPLGPAGYERSMAEYRRPYATADGYVCALPYTTRQWQTFFALMGQDDMCEDPRVVDPALRSEKIGELYAMVARLVRDWNTGELLDALRQGDIPHGEVVALDDLATHPHLEAVGFFRTVDHPTEGRIRFPEPPVRMSGTPPAITTLPARCGEHSVEVLEEAGLSEAEIAALLSEGATVDGREEPVETQLSRKIA